MRIKYILLVLSLFIGSVVLNGQDKKGNSSSFDIDKFKKERAAYFTKELNLTDVEVKAFIPLLDEFMSKKYSINKDYRKQIKDIRRKTTKVTDAEYTSSTDAFLDAKIKEAELQKEYYKKFMKILPAEKVYKLQFVEVDFMKQALENHRQKHKHRGR